MPGRKMLGDRKLRKVREPSQNSPIGLSCYMYSKNKDKTSEAGLDASVVLKLQDRVLCLKGCEKMSVVKKPVKYRAKRVGLTVNCFSSCSTSSCKSSSAEPNSYQCTEQQSNMEDRNKVCSGIYLQRSQFRIHRLHSHMALHRQRVRKTVASISHTRIAQHLHAQEIPHCVILLGHHESTGIGFLAVGLVN